MDLDVVFLGTAGSMPTAQRAPSALLVRRGGERILVDCGEGTQRQLLRSTVGLVELREVLITHYHADHAARAPPARRQFGAQIAIARDAAGEIESGDEAATGLQAARQEAEKAFNKYRIDEDAAAKTEVEQFLAEIDADDDVAHTPLLAPTLQGLTALLDGADERDARFERVLCCHAERARSRAGEPLGVVGDRSEEVADLELELVEAKPKREESDCSVVVLQPGWIDELLHCGCGGRHLHSLTSVPDSRHPGATSQIRQP